MSQQLYYASACNDHDILLGAYLYGGNTILATGNIIGRKQSQVGTALL